MQPVDILIIGGGPAGVSAALWCKRLGINHLLIEKNNELGGQLAKIHNEIIDYPGLYSNNGKEMLRIFTTQLEDRQCPYLLNIEIISLNMENRTIKIKQDNELLNINFKYIILATGASQRTLGVLGEKEMMERGEVYSATADAYLFKNKTVAVVGGGDRAVEGALLLADFAERVYLIHRTRRFKAQSQYMDILMAKENITIIPDTIVTAIKGEESVTSIDVKNLLGETGTLKLDAILVRIGIKPNSELVKDLINMNQHGLIVTDHIGRTNHPYIFAIGDVCTDSRLSSITASVGQGAIVAKHISSLLTVGSQNEYHLKNAKNEIECTK
nr:NAD(P)/FAD-dependent oxidoreductase [Neobacillus sp. Marseille-Q6967]